METNILIGKYTLESLTSGMYLSPLDIYREYIQNAADSIDEAVERKIISQYDSEIYISLDTKQKSIVVRDNGVGIDSKHAISELVDIGNSKKNYQYSRGFRGIGRLSGLGYCDQLEFITSALNDSTKTTVIFDSNLLQRLLQPGEGEQEQLSDVLNKVITTKQEEENKKEHYFIVRMTGIHEDEGLLNRNNVYKYLTQNLPLPFSKDFFWGKIINEKIKLLGINIPEYKVIFECDGDREQLFKPYKNTILSDRVRHIEDPIQDIIFKLFYINENLSALLWYVDNNYYGTILDNQIKGIRIRNGNILFGDQGSLRKCFKEQRFNGWLCGELHMISSRLIPNARRDDFERNNEYLELMSKITEWANSISKKIRKKSHQRNLDEVANQLVEAANKKEEQNLISFNDQNNSDIGEDRLMEMNDSQELAQIDLLNSLSILANTSNNLTKYKSLNLSNKLTKDQKLIYEKIFDLMYKKFNKKTANNVVQAIINNLVL